MKKFSCVLLLALLLLFSFAGCTEEPADPPVTEPCGTEEPSSPVLMWDTYTVDIYRCDDVYRTEETPTHGSGKVALIPPGEPLAVTDVKIIACTDGCRREDVVSRAAQGYAQVARIVEGAFWEGKYPTYLRLRFRRTEERGKACRERGGSGRCGGKQRGGGMVSRRGGGLAEGDDYGYRRVGFASLGAKALRE